MATSNDLPAGAVEVAYQAYWDALDERGVEPEPMAAMRAALQAVLDAGKLARADTPEAQLAAARKELSDEQAAHAQDVHVRRRLEEELAKVRKALEPSGYEYCEGYDRPIRQLVQERDQLRKALSDVLNHGNLSSLWPKGYKALRETMDEVPPGHGQAGTTGP